MSKAEISIYRGAEQEIPITKARKDENTKKDNIQLVFSGFHVFVMKENPLQAHSFIQFLMEKAGVEGCQSDSPIQRWGFFSFKKPHHIRIDFISPG